MRGKLIVEIGILSDTHNNQENLKRALEIFRQHEIRTLIHCGDITSPQTAALMSGFRVIHVTGNMASAPGAIRRTLLALNPENHSAPSFSGQLAGVWVGAIHGHVPLQYDQMVGDGRYAYLFHGHTHRRRDEWSGQTRIINPGALGGARHEARSIGLVDLSRGEARFLHVADS